MAEAEKPQKIPLIFFRTLAGIEPVREWLKGLPEAERLQSEKICYGLNGAGQWGCPSAAQWEAAFGKSEQTSPQNVPLAYWYVLTRSTLLRCTGLSRKRGRRRIRI
jgi:hypothetical protein